MMVKYFFKSLFRIVSTVAITLLLGGATLAVSAFIISLLQWNCIWFVLAGLAFYAVWQGAKAEYDCDRRRSLNEINCRYAKMVMEIPFDEAKVNEVMEAIKAFEEKFGKDCIVDAYRRYCNEVVSKYAEEVNKND